MNNLKLETIDPGKAAIFIRGMLGAKNLKQVYLASQVGIHRAILNLYLNRRINLLPEDIDKILNELEIDKSILLIEDLDE